MPFYSKNIMHCIPSTKFSGADTPGHLTTIEGDLAPILGMLPDYQLVMTFAINYFSEYF